jgi:uncharacterized protein (DUF2147 family)
MLNLAQKALPGTLLLFTLAAQGSERVPISDLLGPWMTEKKGAVIDIYECGEGERALCGRIAWLKKPYTDEGELKRDPENPDSSLRDRPLCGIEVLTGLKRMDKDTWAFGDVYNPKDGNEYSAYLDAREDGTLHIRGYLGIPLIGKSETWSRPQGIDIACPVE